MSVIIPDKTYFKIGEVSKLIDVKPYILRYWESEFRVLRPQKSRSRHRLYRRRDVEILLQIKQLLYDEKYTIAGAKLRIAELMQAGSFVPGRSGLAITESEVDAADSKASDPGSVEDRPSAPHATGATPDASGDAAPQSNAIEVADAQLIEARAELAEARAELAEARTQIDQLSIQAQRLNKELSEAQAQAEGLIAERQASAQTHSELAELRAALAAVSVERDGLIATRDRLREKLRVRKAETEGQYGELESTQDALAAATEELGVLREALDASIAARTAAERSAAEAAQLERARDIAQSELTERERELARAVEQTRATQTERDAANRASRKAQAAWEAERAETADQLAQLQAALQHQSGRADEAERQLQQTQQALIVREQTSEIADGLAREKSELERRLQTHRVSRHTLSTDLRDGLAELSTFLEGF